MIIFLTINFLHRTEIETTVGTSSITHEFQYDSSSPLIQYINGRAHTIGIAGFIGYYDDVRLNTTIVYAQISKYVKWIKDTIKLMGEKIESSRT
jgi:hypothetical protein